MSSLLTELVEATGVPHYRTTGAYNSKDGCLIGFRRGVLLEVGVNRRDIYVVFRTRTISGTAELKAALEQNPEIRAVDSKPTCTLSTDTVTWAFHCPSGLTATKLAAGVDSAIATIVRFAGSLKENTCDQCSRPATIVLMNGIPKYACERCKEESLKQQQQYDIAYKAITPNYIGGVLYGLLGAITYVLLWGFCGAWIVHKTDTISVKVFMVVFLVLGVVIAKLVVRGTQKCTPAAMTVAAVLTLAALLAGDFLFYCYYYVLKYRVGFLAVLPWVANNYWRVKTGSDTAILFSIFDLLGAFVAALTVWESRPKFKINFEYLGSSTPAEESTAALVRS